jgi:uncharacterized protein (TIGR02147 family)
MGSGISIFDYQDFRDFLMAVFAEAKSRKKGPTRKQVASELGISLSNLSMILSGDRKLVPDLTLRMGRAMGLDASEQRYFEALVMRDQAESGEAEVDSLTRMNSMKKFREKNPRESEVLRYLTHWYYVAIREMSGLPDFVLDAKWIKKRLASQIPLSEIQRALEFLLDRGYIERLPDGKITPPEKTLDCMDGVYRAALGQFHREVLDLASKSVTEVPAAERNLMGFTFACAKEDFERASKIIERAHSEIRELARVARDGDSVYHVELCLFPLTRREGSS